MQIPFVVPLLVVTLSLTSCLSDCNSVLADAPDQKSAAQDFCETIFQEWFHLHSKAAHKGEHIRAHIVFDPERRALTLMRGGNAPTKRIELPHGMTWRAFQISVHGVRELSFPVVLRRPNHHDARSEQDDEEILIIGDASKTQTYFQIGSRVTGVTAGGSGPGRGISKRSTFSFQMPERRDRRFQSKVSMLSRDAIQKQPYDSLQFGDVRVQVSRTPIK